MEDRVRRALARWPDVPALYGWLALQLHAGPPMTVQFKDMVLTPPSEAYVAEKLVVVDPQRIHAVPESQAYAAAPRNCLRLDELADVVRRQVRVAVLASELDHRLGSQTAVEVVVEEDFGKRGDVHEMPPSVGGRPHGPYPDVPWNTPN